MFLSLCWSKFEISVLFRFACGKNKFYVYGKHIIQDHLLKAESGLDLNAVQHLGAFKATNVLLNKKKAVL